MSITNLTDSDRQRLGITLLTESELHFKLLNNYGTEAQLEVEYLGEDGDLTIALNECVRGYNGALLNKEQLDVLKRFLLKL